MDEKIILYTSNYAPLRRLSPERKAVLFDAIFLYASSQDLPEMDEITELAFGFLQNAMDHTRDKIESIRNKRSEAGKKHKGNQFVQDWEQTEQIGTNGTNVPILEQTEQTEQSEKNGTINITKHNITKHNITEHNITEQNKTASAMESIDTLVSWYRSTASFEQFCMLNSLPPDKGAAMLARFATYLKAQGIETKTRKDFTSHLLNWAKYERQQTQTAPNGAIVGRPSPPSVFANGGPKSTRQ